MNDILMDYMVTVAYDDVDGNPRAIKISVRSILDSLLQLNIEDEDFRDIVITGNAMQMIQYILEYIRKDDKLIETFKTSRLSRSFMRSWKELRVNE